MTLKGNEYLKKLVAEKVVRQWPDRPDRRLRPCDIVMLLAMTDNKAVHLSSRHGGH